MAASSGADTDFRTGKDSVEGTAGSRGVFELVRPDEARRSSKGVVRLSVPTAFLRSWINGHYLDLIAELWRQEEPELLKIEIVVRTATRQARRRAEHEQLARRARPARRRRRALGYRHARQRRGRSGCRQATGMPSRARVPPERARLAARSALHVPVLRRRAVEPRRLRRGARGRRESVERALQSAVPACDGRARQDPSAAGDRGRVAEAEPASRASSI